MQKTPSFCVAVHFICGQADTEQKRIATWACWVIGWRQFQQKKKIHRRRYIHIGNSAHHSTIQSHKPKVSSSQKALVNVRNASRHSQLYAFAQQGPFLASFRGDVRAHALMFPRARGVMRCIMPKNPWIRRRRRRRQNNAPGLLMRNRMYKRSLAQSFECRCARINACSLLLHCLGHLMAMIGHGTSPKQISVESIGSKPVTHISHRAATDIGPSSQCYQLSSFCAQCCCCCCLWVFFLVDLYCFHVLICPHRAFSVCRYLLCARVAMSAVRVERLNKFEHGFVFFSSYGSFSRQRTAFAASSLPSHCSCVSKIAVVDAEPVLMTTHTHTYE